MEIGLGDGEKVDVNKKWFRVLILVLVEIGLGVAVEIPFALAIVCLNPCFSGNRFGS